MEARRVTASFSVSPQIMAADIEEARAAGFVQIVNNRPEGEAPDQPAGAAIEAACRAAGLFYLAIPVRGAPNEDQARAMKAAVDGAGGATLAFCRSGTRSIGAWAVGEALAGTPRGELLNLAKAAGYDLSALLA
ncbi:MAG: TIGR01244 family sulfur transferase [Caulobacteraceae bacterium]